MSQLSSIPIFHHVSPMGMIPFPAIDTFSTKLSLASVVILVNGTYAEYQIIYAGVFQSYLLHMLEM